VNPKAGKTAVDIDDVHRAARDCGVEMQVSVSSSRDQAAEAVAAAVRDGHTRFVAIGGDGTANLVANTLFSRPSDSRFTLGVISIGSGSDLARTFAHTKGLRAGMARLADHELYPFDVGVVTVGGSSTHFLNAVNIGVGAASVVKANRIPRRFGSLRYTVGFWLALAGYNAAHMDVTIDHHAFSGQAINVVVANGQFFGGGMNIAPRASTSDGLFDVQVFSGPKRQAFIVMPRVLLGTHLTHPSVRRYVGSRVTLTGAGDLIVESDGELLGEGPVEISILPSALDLVI
jgi:YegS/Rv2252/BmrU family lipid kinase